MFEHLTNCHGEWNALMAASASLPFAALWVKLKFKTLNPRIKE